MPTGGEKLLSHVLELRPGTGSFNTVIPGATGASAGSCSNTPGSGNQYVFSVTTGTGRYQASTVGILGPALFFSDDSIDTKSDSPGRRVRSTTRRAVTVGQSGVTTGGNSAPTEVITETVGRLTWRQIYNYQDQKN